MRVEVRAARPGDGAALARVWLDNARYYVDLFPDDFRVPDEAGLAEWFDVQLGRPQSAVELHLVAVVDGSVGAFVYARLTEPDEHASRQMLADYTGRYELAPGFLLEVKAENGQLYVQATGQPSLPVYATARDEFYYRVVDAQLSFIRAADGKVKEVVLHQNGRDVRGAKQ